MKKFTHILLTRYNVITKDWVNKPNEKWLSDRIKLFERFCFPSVQNQTNQNFIWLVFFDKDSPDILKNKINNTYKKYKNFNPVYIEFFEIDEIRKYIKENLFTDFLITTRLDNDDAIRADYINEIQNNFNNQNGMVLNFNYGYVLDYSTYKLYQRNHYINAFCTLIEKSESFNTVWIKDHRELNTMFKLKNIKSKPYWLQIVHSKNISNTISSDVYRIKIPLDFHLNFIFNNIYFTEINESKDYNILLERAKQIIPYYFRICFRPFKRFLVDTALFFKGKNIKYGSNFLIK